MVMVVFNIDVGFSLLRLDLLELIFVFVELGRIFRKVRAVRQFCVEYIQ